jgi:uncharacterized membrane protein YhaH (DUF805 family)
MFKNPFSLTGRIRRTEWALSILIYYGATFMIGFFLGFIGVTDGETYGLGILYIAMLPMLYFQIVQGAKRCHDRNCSGWWQLVPFYPLWMLFAEGTRGPNEYGADPKNPHLTSETGYTEASTTSTMDSGAENDDINFE